MTRTKRRRIAKVYLHLWLMGWDEKINWGQDE